MSESYHLVFRGSPRFREDYEVQSRDTGKRLGKVNQVERRCWRAEAEDGTRAYGPTMRAAALALWGSP